MLLNLPFARLSRSAADRHIRREQRLVVIGGDTGGKAAVGGFHISVPVVDADYFCVVGRFHFRIILIYSDL
jgi:hypothetical protein